MFGKNMSVFLKHKCAVSVATFYIWRMSIKLNQNGLA